MIFKAIRHVSKHGFSAKRRGKEKGDGVVVEAMNTEIEGDNNSEKDKDLAGNSTDGIKKQIILNTEIEGDNNFEKDEDLAGNSADGIEKQIIFNQPVEINMTSEGSVHDANTQMVAESFPTTGSVIDGKIERTGSEHTGYSSSGDEGENEVRDVIDDECIKLMDDGVTKGGYLQKKGRGRNDLIGAFHRPWTTRYITVDTVQGILKYYRNESDVQRKPPRGEMYISGAKVECTLRPTQLPPTSPSPSPSLTAYQLCITATPTTGKVENLILTVSESQNENLMREWIDIFSTICVVEGADLGSSKAINGSTEEKQLVAKCSSCGFMETLKNRSSSSTVQYCCSSCGSFQVFDISYNESQEKGDEEVSANGISRDRVISAETIDFYDLNPGDYSSTISHGSYEFATLRQMLTMNKDDLINEVMKYSKDDIVEVLVSVRNRLSYSSPVGSPSLSTSFPVDSTGNPKSTRGTTDEGVVDNENTAEKQQYAYMIGKESVSKEVRNNYNTLMRMNIRLLKNMCLKFLKEDEVPTDKHTMAMFLLRHGTEEDTLSPVSRGSSLSNLAVEFKSPPNEREEGLLPSRANPQSSMGHEKKNIAFTETDIQTINQKLRGFALKHRENAGDIKGPAIGLKVHERRAKSAPAKVQRNVSPVTRRIRTYTKASLPSGVNFHEPALKSSITPSPYFFKKPLNIDDLPKSTREFQYYARLSKLSHTQLQQELINHNLFGYRFRSPHEVKMAIVQIRDVQGEENGDVIMDKRLNSSELTKEFGVDFNDFQSTPNSSLSSDNTSREKEMFSPRTFSAHRSGNVSPSVAAFKKKEMDMNTHHVPDAGTDGPGSYYYKRKLTYQLPTKTKEYIEYGKLSRMSVLALSKELEKLDLGLYKFRNSHESVMAIINSKMNEEQKTPFSLASSSHITERSLSTGSIPTNRRNSPPRGKMGGKTSLVINVPPLMMPTPPRKRNLVDHRLSEDDMKSMYISNPLVNSAQKNLNDMSLSSLGNYQTPSPQVDSPSILHSENAITTNLKKSGRLGSRENTSEKQKYFFRNKLTVSLPVNPKQSVDYGKFSRMSSRGLDVEVNKHGLGDYRYRNDHEKIMAMISAKYNTIANLRSSGVVAPSSQTGLSRSFSSSNGSINHDFKGKTTGVSQNPENDKMGRDFEAASTSQIATKLRMHKISPEKFAYNRELMLQALMKTDQNKIAGLFKKKSTRMQKKLQDDHGSDQRNKEHPLDPIFQSLPSPPETEIKNSVPTMSRNVEKSNENSSDSEGDVEISSPALQRKKRVSYERYQRTFSHSNAVSRAPVVQESPVNVKEESDEPSPRGRTRSGFELQEVHKIKSDAYRRLTTPTEE